MSKGIEIKRHFTKEGFAPVEQMDWTQHAINGRKVEAPKSWSETATEIASLKYFRQRGVGPGGFGGETSVRQLMGRVTSALALAAEWQGHLTGAALATFCDEVEHILLNQIASFNSPVYFNVGIFPSYGILGSAENFVYDEKSGAAIPLTSAYVHPQASACFIQDIQDDLISIFDLLKNEAKLFKYGSGTGTNFSKLRARGEPLDQGGESTGLISYLEVFDKAAHAIKSGGTTRRAAKMVVLDVDHPEALEFIRWKVLEERKARVLIAAGYSSGMEGEAFSTVSGQNANNSVRVTDDFMNRALRGDSWNLTARKTGAVVQTLPAKDLWREIARAAWECADPGVHYADTIQKWHVCKESGEIRSSNPCSEYLFLDNSACNLASINLVKFLTGKEVAADHPDAFDWKSFAHTVRVMLFAQEIMVDYASYPTAKIAENSHRFRPLGLGFANLGGFLMRLGIPYESESARVWTRRITAALHVLALETSAQMAEQLGAFAGWEENRESALAVLENHRGAWRDVGDLAWVTQAFDRVLSRAEKHGLRNAQVTLIAPTGTIGLLMDCDTLGIEPEFALLKRKTLAGGGELRLVNQSVRAALLRLGYTDSVTFAIENFIRENGHPVGAPGLRPEHFSVFDCAVPPKVAPERCISPNGHLQIMAAAQPFLSGGISKTINLPAGATVEDVERVFFDGWRMGLKALSVYRDGSKTLQPLCAEC